MLILALSHYGPRRDLLEEPRRISRSSGGSEPPHWQSFAINTQLTIGYELQ